MVALYIILGIILFFVLVLSIRVKVYFDYSEEVKAYAQWLFLKIPLIPLPEKKPKKTKDKPKENKPEEKKEEKPKADKPKTNPLKTFYENEKLEGVLDIVGRLLKLLDKFGRRFAKSFFIGELFFNMSVTGDDAASTAEEYGKMCRRVFPVFGALCANCEVRKYNVNVYPDYIAKGGNDFEFFFNLSLIPRKLINAAIMFAFGALFKVLIRFLKGAKLKQPQEPAKKEQTENPEININSNTKESGAKI